MSDHQTEREASQAPNVDNTEFLLQNYMAQRLRDAKDATDTPQESQIDEVPLESDEAMILESMTRWEPPEPGNEAGSVRAEQLRTTYGQTDTEEMPSHVLDKKI